MFENVKNRKTPIGMDFIKSGILTEEQVGKVLEYQKDNKDLKFGEVVDVLDMCDKNSLLDILSKKLDCGTTMLNEEITINPTDYLPRDIIISYRAMPFKLENKKLSIAFVNYQDKTKVKEIELMIMNLGLEMQPYVTLYTSIMRKISGIKTVETQFVNQEEKDTTKLIDNIISNAIEKRASDIHIEPIEDKIRVRYRIDGILLEVTELPKKRQELIIGRIKSISNMHQELSIDQDGSINTYENFSIRVSSQKNVHGEKFVLRLLRKNANVRNLFELGYPKDRKLISNAFEKQNSLVLVCAPTGEGKTTTLYSVLDYLDQPGINVITIENPVEIRMRGINQIEIGSNMSFDKSLRTVLRQDPDVILVGEIRDRETAAIVIEAAQTGHLVLSTIHTIDAVEAITRIKRMGVSEYDLSATLVTSISQRLVRKLCNKCKKEHELSKTELEYIDKVSKKYGVKFDVSKVKTYEPVGCKECNKTGYFDRIGIFETLLVDEDIKELISNNKSSIEIKKYATEKTSYKPMIVDGINRVLDGSTDLNELNKIVSI